MKKVIFIILFTLLGVLSAQAYDFEVDGIYYAYREDYRENLNWGETGEWELIDGEVEVVYKEAGDITSYSGVVVIPSTVTYRGSTYVVTAIGGVAFSACSGLMSVTIPNSVTSIGNGAFGGCSGLTSVTIPEGVTEIGKSTFQNCSGLTSVTIPNSVTSIGYYAFFGCSGLTSVEWNAIACQDFDYAAARPFYNCENITTITFGNQVEHIPAYLCFGMNKLTSVTIPESVTFIGNSAFSGCSGLTKMMIPENVTEIGSYAFSGCSGLTTVTIPEGVTAIGWGTFSGCSGLTTVTIPEGVTAIGWETFSGCSGLTTVTIPENVTSIGSSAFSGCSGLTTVTIPENVDTIGSFAFRGCASISSPLYNSKIFAYLPQNYSGEYAIPSGIQFIAPYAFVDCQDPISVTIPNSMTSIGSSAFSDCSGLTTVIIPESVDTIRESAFSGCENLLSVTSLSKTPPYCEAYVFAVYGTLYVPWGCKIAYQTAQEWYKFIRIEELPSAGTATVTVRPNDASMGTVVGGGEYDLDEQAILAAIPNKGYYFDRWNDGNTSNPRILTVTGDTTLTAIFAPNGGDPTANENSDADNLRVYVQDRTIYLSENVDMVQVYNVAGQCIYNGRATTIPVQQIGVYVVRVGARSYKMIVR